MSLTSLDKLLQARGRGALGKVVRRAKAMGDLTQSLKSALAEDTAPHLIAANVHDDGELVLVCSSSSWASRIRFESEALLDAATMHGEKVDRCTVKVTK